MTKNAVLSDEFEAALTPAEMQEFAAGVARGRADIAAGRMVSAQQVSAWVTSWGAADELPQPKPVAQA